jgi:hypothetical protein
MMPTISGVRALLLCPFLWLSLAAQEPAPRWENVKMLAPGSELRVVSTASAKPIQGKLKSITDSDLEVKRGSGAESFARAQIVSVFARQKGHRLRNTLIGLGVGTVAGALIGYGIGHRQASDCQKSGGGWCDLDEVGGAGLGGLSGLLGGTLLGAFWHTGKWAEIYRVSDRGRVRESP